MSDNVRIPVEIDTREAKAKLKQLHKDKGRTQKRITSAARRTSRMATRAFAFTGATSVISKFKNNEPGGNVSMYDEAMSPFLAKTQQFTDEQLGWSAKARKSAREQTKAAFAYHVGKTGNMAGATDFYNTVSKIQADVESGRNLIRQDPRFLGPDVSGATGAAITGNIAIFFQNLSASNPITQLIMGADYIIDGINAD